MESRRTVSHCPFELAQLAQLERRFEFFREGELRKIKGLVGVAVANGRVVPTIPIFF